MCGGGRELGCGLVLTVWVVCSAECKKTIDAASARDHDQQLYCRTCHGRLFGPKGYGFAGGAGNMLSMDTGKTGDVPTKYAAAVFSQLHITCQLMCACGACGWQDCQVYPVHT